MTRHTILMLLVSVVLVLGGCGTPDMCATRDDYKSVRQTEKIRVPGELDPLPDVTQLEIPSSSTPPDADQACLELPPPYFDEEGSVAQ